MARFRELKRLFDLSVLAGLLQWRLEVEDLPMKKDQKWLKITAAIVVPLLFTLLIIGVYFGLKYRKMRKKRIDEKSKVVGTLKSLPGIPREFQFKEMKAATRNFHPSFELGRGGFGVVYKGIFAGKDTGIGRETRTEIAVKQFSRDSLLRRCFSLNVTA